MPDATPSATAATVDAALALAESAAAAGTAAGQLGYTLTQKALQSSSAAAVFPLLLLEGTAVATGFAAYIGSEAAWQVAQANAAANTLRGELQWNSSP